ncbi:hypothetical protein TOK_0880 [Pseudonocardia sp. N23]|nr:hypothetical protein TOK_0880 [Pseudonocardia sp. N23]
MVLPAVIGVVPVLLVVCEVLSVLLVSVLLVSVLRVGPGAAAVVRAPGPRGRP